MLTPKCRPRQICLDNTKAVWKAYNAETGQRYVALFNLSGETAVVSVEAQAVGFSDGEELTELWTGEGTKIAKDRLQAELPSHGCVVYTR